MTNGTLNHRDPEVVDMHFHVAVRGDSDPKNGGLTEKLRNLWPVYDIILMYLGIGRGDDTDEQFEKRGIEEIVRSKRVGRVVCLAQDPVYDRDGKRREGKSPFWVSNAYVRDLCRRPELQGLALYGASVHPFRTEFEADVEECVADGAVLMKWLPSAQQFSLEDPKVRKALKFLATAKQGKPLPLLLHVGYEGANPTSKAYTKSYDYLSWGFWDKFRNFWRFGDKKWHDPVIPEVRRTLDEGLEAGAVIIMAHAGLPYFAAHAAFLEHSDFPVVREYLERTARGETGKGRCYADVSACATPFRQAYFDDIAKLPPDLVLFGSDFPTPVFELSAGLDEAWRDFKDVLKGRLERIVVPNERMIDANYTQLAHYFPDHPMFTNFARQLL